MTTLCLEFVAVLDASNLLVLSISRCIAKFSPEMIKGKADKNFSLHFHGTLDKGMVFKVNQSSLMN